MNEPHPLDQVYDDEDQSPARETAKRAPPPTSPKKDSKSSGPSRTILRTSLIALAIVGFVVFVTAVAASNASANSTTEMVASAANRIATVLLLLAFLGILLAYQFPNIQKLLARMNEGGSPFNAAQAMRGAEATQGVQPPVLSTSLNKSNRNNDFLILAGLNLALLVSLWGLGLLAYAIRGIAFFGFFIGPVFIILPGLLITMIVWNRGFVRAYAIGALTAFVGVLSVSSYLPMLIFSGAGFGRGGPSPESYFLGVGLGLTGVIISGLVSSGYIKVLQSIRNPRDEHQKP